MSHRLPSRKRCRSPTPEAPEAGGLENVAAVDAGASVSLELLTELIQNGTLAPHP